MANREVNVKRGRQLSCSPRVSRINITLVCVCAHYSQTTAKKRKKKAQTKLFHCQIYLFEGFHHKKLTLKNVFSKMYLLVGI